jgi:hypothetical protein
VYEEGHERQLISGTLEVSKLITHDEDKPNG